MWMAIFSTSAYMPTYISHYQLCFNWLDIAHTYMIPTWFLHRACILPTWRTLEVLLFSPLSFWMFFMVLHHKILYAGSKFSREFYVYIGVYCNFHRVALPNSLENLTECFGEKMCLTQFFSSLPPMEKMCECLFCHNYVGFMYALCMIHVCLLLCNSLENILLRGMYVGM